MSRAQAYISDLLERLPKTALADEDQQLTFDRVRNKISAAPDILDELRALYKVNNFSDFALGLMWIAERVENDPSRLEPTTDEEALAFSTLQKAFLPETSSALPATTQEAPSALETSPVPAEPVAENPFDAFPSEPPPAPVQTEAPAPSESGSPFDAFSTPAAETPQSDFGVPPTDAVAPETQIPTVPSDQALAPEVQVPVEPPVVENPVAESAAPTEPLSIPQPGAKGGSEEQQHAALFEKFIEAQQAASDDRMALFDQLVQTCNNVAAGGGAADYKEYSELLAGLLKSLNDNQMLDDIRAMNMLSTAFDPFTQWAKTDPAGREGMLAQGIEALRGFRALFE